MAGRDGFPQPQTQGSDFLVAGTGGYPHSPSGRQPVALTFLLCSYIWALSSEKSLPLGEKLLRPTSE